MPSAGTVRWPPDENLPIRFRLLSNQNLPEVSGFDGTAWHTIVERSLASRVPVPTADHPEASLTLRSGYRVPFAHDNEDAARSHNLRPTTFAFHLDAREFSRGFEQTTAPEVFDALRRTGRAAAATRA